MNILFNASVCGLGNNGGTKTIIRCAETLQDMGHNVTIWADVNKYTWNKIKVKIIETKHTIPQHFLRAITKMILVSSWELPESTRSQNIHGRIWYCRGWETWVHGEEWLIKQSEIFVAKGGKIICNSSWLVNKFASYDIPAELCFAGLDLDFWNDEEILIEKSDRIGGMIYDRHKTKNSDLVRKYCNYTLSIKSGYNDIELMTFYKNCDIWLSPTELEGFHNVAAEANLCGCLVVCNRLDSNGMGDYATEETAMRYTGHNELLACLENPDFSKVKKMQTVLREKIGSRLKNMKRFVGLIGG